MPADTEEQGSYTIKLEVTVDAQGTATRNLQRVLFEAFRTERDPSFALAFAFAAYFAVRYSALLFFGRLDLSDVSHV